MFPMSDMITIDVHLLKCTICSCLFVPASGQIELSTHMMIKRPRGDKSFLTKDSTAMRPINNAANWDVTMPRRVRIKSEQTFNDHLTKQKFCKDKEDVQK